MRPEQTKEGRSGSSFQRGEAFEGSLLAPPTHHVVFLMKGAGRLLQLQPCSLLWARGALLFATLRWRVCDTTLDSKAARGLSHPMAGQSPICWERQPFSCSQPRPVTWDSPWCPRDGAAQQLEDGVVPSSSAKAAVLSPALVALPQPQGHRHVEKGCAQGKLPGPWAAGHPPLLCRVGILHWQGSQ